MTYVISVKGSVVQHITKIATLLSILALGIMLPAVSHSSETEILPNNLVVEGLVSNPLNLTYAEVENLPQVSEIALLKCVYAPSGAPFNWTGVPLFYLLNLARVQPGAKKVVFRGADGFSSSLTLDKAMHPTTLLALEVNGTTLPETQALFGGLPAGYPYKIVAPCKEGYKWVGWINEIEVVDYDYKGTYESQGFSDDASIPNCTALPETEPAYATLNITQQADLNLTVFSDNTLSSAVFNETTKHIQLSLSQDSPSGFVFLIVPEKLLNPAFMVFSDGTPTQCNVMQSQTNSFIYFTISQGTHNMEIKGTLSADITGPQGVPDGRVDLRDVSYVAKRFMSTSNTPSWDPRADLNADGKIDMQDVAIVASRFGENNQ
jgi:DMSO/TMAO reductase YedYZ molybdopterin-dependent catalytic subunit